MAEKPKGGKQQSVAGNLNATYTSEESLRDQTPKVTEDGFTVTASEVSRPDLRSSDGYVDPGSSFAALNGGTSISVPTGENVVIEANPNNTNPIEIRDTTNNETFLIQPNKTFNWPAEDITDIEARQTSSGDELQWSFNVGGS